MLVYLAVLLLASNIVNVSGFQCGTLNKYLTCLDLTNQIVGEKIDEQPFNPAMIDGELDTFYYDDVICNCAYKAEKLKYPYMAVYKTAQNTIVCRGIPSSEVKLSIKRRSLMSNGLINLFGDDNGGKCEAVFVIKDASSVMIGTGGHSAIYEVYPSTVTVPPTTATEEPTTRVVILVPTTQGKIEYPDPPNFDFDDEVWQPALP